MGKKNRKPDETDLNETAPAGDGQREGEPGNEGPPSDEGEDAAEVATDSAAPTEDDAARKELYAAEQQNLTPPEQGQPGPQEPHVYRPGPLGPLDERGERNLVVKALAKTALALGRRVGWLIHDARPVLTIETLEGPIGFHFSKEEFERLPGLPFFEGKFDGADDRVRAERLERLVLK